MVDVVVVDDACEARDAVAGFEFGDGGADSGDDTAGVAA